MVNPKETLEQYNAAVAEAKEIFVKKSSDYAGLAPFALLRDESIIDQIFIKLQRIRTLQEMEKNGVCRKVKDSKKDDFVGVVNYCIMALVRRATSVENLLAMTPKEASDGYDKVIIEVRDLMIAKNHDYGEAWRMMSQASFVDLSLAKIERMKALLKSGEKTLISEGINANYHDIINYAIFALIRIKEGGHTP